jgi:hypothetical protein
LDAIKIDTLRSNIQSDLSDYTVIIGNVMNRISSAPYNAVWVLQIFDFNGGDASNSYELDDLSSSEQTDILSRFDTFYQSNVSAGMSFDLYTGSVIVGTLDISCFGEDSFVLCVDGLKHISKLVAGDKVYTHQRKVTIVEKVFKFKYNGKICTIPRGRFGEQSPFRDLVITPDHKFRRGHKKWMYPNEVVPTKNITKPINLYHVKTNGDSIVVNGLTVETMK